MLTEAIGLTLFPATMAFAASSDLFTMTIANRVSLTLVAGFFLLALLTGMSPAGVGWHIGAGAVVLVIGFGLFSFGWVGGGDAKLLAATALWMGLKALPAFAIYTALAGGALALALVALRSAWLRPLADAGPAWAKRLATPGEAAPYGVAIAVGALAAWIAAPPF